MHIQDVLYYIFWGGLFFAMMRFGCGSHIMGRHRHQTAPAVDRNATISGSSLRVAYGSAGGKLGSAMSPGYRLDTHGVHTLPVVALGLALSLFLLVSYLICITTYLIPGLPVSHAMLTMLLPGFQLLTWQNFGLGLIESFAWGWYVALIFGPLYNFFALRGHPQPQFQIGA